MRLFLHVGAYCLMWSLRLRSLMPRRSHWRVAQFDTLRLRLIKLAVSIKVFKTQVSLHLPSATPDQALFALLLARMPVSASNPRGGLPHLARHRSTPTPNSH